MVANILVVVLVQYTVVVIPAMATAMAKMVNFRGGINVVNLVVENAFPMVKYLAFSSSEVEAKPRATPKRAPTARCRSMSKFDRELQ